MKFRAMLFNIGILLSGILLSTSSQSFAGQRRAGNSNSGQIPRKTNSGQIQKKGSFPYQKYRVGMKRPAPRTRLAVPGH